MQNEVVVTFGRFQPPTRAHVMLFEVMERLAEGNPFYVFASHVEDKKKNPLKYKDKLKYLELSYPTATFVDTTEIRTLFDVLRYFDHKVKSIIFVVGEDRCDSVRSMFVDYQFCPDDSIALHYEKWDVVQAGSSRTGIFSNSINSISSTKVREFALEGNFKRFEKVVPKSLTSSQKLSLYNKVRLGLLFE